MKSLQSGFGDFEVSVSEDNPIFDLEAFQNKVEEIKIGELKSLSKN